MKRIFKYTFLWMLLVSMLLSLCACDFCFHDYEETTITVSCEENGKTVKTCRKCGHTEETDIVYAKGHAFAEIKNTADCNEAGYTEYICLCGFSYKGEFVPALGHSFTETVNDPTCETSSVVIYTCDCGYSRTAVISAPNGHDLTAAVTPPTCTEKGYTTYTCHCGYSYNADFKPALGHVLTETVNAPTCDKGGTVLYTCQCGYSHTAEAEAPYGHTLKERVIAPTCTEVGYTTYTCDCGFTYDSDLVAPRGHRFAEEVTMPTVSSYGYTVFTCDCGFTYTGSYRFYSDILPDAYAGNNTVLAEGVDVSQYQHTMNNRTQSYNPLDWTALKDAGVDYAILKIGSTVREGADGTVKGGLEPTFEMDYADAKAAGIDLGVYFYTYATTVKEIRADAQWMLQHLEGKQFEYPIYLDLEDPSLVDLGGPLLTEMCMEFFTVLQENGYYTGLYVNNEWLRVILQTEKMIDNFEIWYARYPGTDTPEWDTEKYGAHLGMWQYSDSGRFEAIPEIPFDLNFAYKDYPSLIKQYGFNGYTD